MKNFYQSMMLNLMLFLFSIQEALAASSTGGTSALQILSQVETWVKGGSVTIAVILVIIGGLKIANGDEKATTAGGRLLIGGLFIGCAGWFVGNMISY